MSRLWFVVAIIIVLVFSLYAWQGVTRYSQDTFGAALLAGCDAIFFGDETQPVFTIAIGCPGSDLMRLWPLPIQDPWFEDNWNPVDGSLNL
jgi:hypothetical protein